MNLQLVILTAEGTVWSQIRDLPDVEAACDYAAEKVGARWEVHDADTDEVLATGCGKKRLS